MSHGIGHVNMCTVDIFESHFLSERSCSSAVLSVVKVSEEPSNWSSCMLHISLSYQHVWHLGPLAWAGLCLCSAWPGSVSQLCCVDKIQNKNVISQTDIPFNFSTPKRHVFTFHLRTADTKSIFLKLWLHPCIFTGTRCIEYEYDQYARQPVRDTHYDGMWAQIHIFNIMLWNYTYQFTYGFTVTAALLINMMKNINELIETENVISHSFW